MDEKARDFKTTFEQWKVVVECFEETPILLKNKFSNFDGDKTTCRVLWEQLVLRLNSMGEGVRSVEKWQMAIGRWKSKVKAKASAIKIEIERTGGGQVNAPPLNVVEEKLMVLLGWKSVSGDQNIELGMQSTSSTGGHLSQLPSLPSTSREDPTILRRFDTNLPPPLTKLTTPKRKMDGQCDETPPRKKVLRSTEKSRRFVSLNRMHDETLQRLTNIDSNVAKIASCLEDIAATTRSCVDFMKNKSESDI